MKIEERIKSEAEKYEIKTTSQQILNRFKAKKQKQPFFRRPLILTLSLAMLIIIIAIPVALNLNKEHQHYQPNEVNIENKGSGLNDRTLLSSMSFQLFYGGYMLDATEQNITTSKMSLKVSDEDFMRAKQQYSQVFPMIEPMFNNEQGLVSQYESIDFNYANKEYYYLMQVADFKLYLQEDIQTTQKRLNALYYLDGQYFNGYIQAEVEHDEAEIVMSFVKGSQTIIIERDLEKTEFSIEYVVMENGKEVSCYEVEIEYEDNELICSYEYVDSTTELEIETTKNGNIYSIVYQEESKQYEIELKMTLTVTNDEYIYELN